MEWRKLGRIFAPPGELAWVHSHAMSPFALPLGGSRYRIYFAGRDDRSRARIGFLEIDLTEPARVLRSSAAPVLDLGSLGCFDDSGVLASWLVPHGGRLFHYYGGWSLGVSVPFYCFVGLALSDDGGESFTRVHQAPILERCAADPLMNGSPCVLERDGRWRMWYYSGVRWDPQPQNPKHFYHIRYAESRDGVTWTREGRVAIDFQSSDEYAIARPSVLWHGGRYRMWYCYRGAAYRIGYAESPDGLAWTRLDDRCGLDVSPTGWDSEMVEYPHVFEHAGRLFMLYNGNGYGVTGFGLAVLDE